nr:YHS domain-containing protein [Sphingobium sp.]
MAGDDSGDRLTSHSEYGRHTHHNPEEGDAYTSGRRVKDPVCGMLVDPTAAASRTDYDSHSYVFCSAGCKAKVRCESRSLCRFGSSRAEQRGRCAANYGSAPWGSWMRPRTPSPFFH